MAKRTFKNIASVPRELLMRYLDDAEPIGECLISSNTAGTIYYRGQNLSLVRCMAHFYGLTIYHIVTTRCGSRRCLKKEHIWCPSPADHKQERPRRYRMSPAQRFWNQVVKTPTCWLWKGAIDPSGYGIFRSLGQSGRAHRFAYEMVHGPIRHGLIIRHNCDRRNCVRVDHLEEGTHQQNVEDCIARERTRWHRVARGELPPARKSIKCLFSCGNCQKPVLRRKSQLLDRPIAMAFCNSRCRFQWQRMVGRRDPTRTFTSMGIGTKRKVEASRLRRCEVTGRYTSSPLDRSKDFKLESIRHRSASDGEGEHNVSVSRRRPWIPPFSGAWYEEDPVEHDFD